MPHELFVAKQLAEVIDTMSIQIDVSHSDQILIQKRLLKDVKWAFLSVLISIFQKTPFPKCREAILLKILTKWRLLLFCEKSVQVIFFH